jgi:hypothetical protein
MSVRVDRSNGGDAIAIQARVEEVAAELQASLPEGVTMELIPQNIHATGGGASTPHMGGASLYEGSNASEF